LEIINEAATARIARVVERYLLFISQRASVPASERASTQ
jgi:hypothetical protein